MDKLSAVLQRFSLRAHVFNTGPLCKTATFSKEAGHGHIHLLEQGALRLEAPTQQSRIVRAPYLLFYLKPTSHRLVPVKGEPPSLVCGEIDFGEGLDNPVARAMPELLALDLGQHEQLQRIVDMMFGEAFSKNCGRQAALDRICELLVIELLRLSINDRLTEYGVLAGLADNRLAKALNTIHENPSRPWTLEELAGIAGMSRASFAVSFREVVGMTPGNYMGHWRLGLAKELLRKGRPMSLVSDEVGYSNPGAFSRAFSSRFGVTPSSWLKQAS